MNNIFHIVGFAVPHESCPERSRTTTPGQREPCDRATGERHDHNTTEDSEQNAYSGGICVDGSIKGKVKAISSDTHQLNATLVHHFIQCNQNIWHSTP